MSVAEILAQHTTLELERIQLSSPVRFGSQRAAALRFGTERVQALLGALVIFRLQPAGFRAAELRAQIAPLLGPRPDELSQVSLAA